MSASGQGAEIHRELLIAADTAEAAVRVAERFIDLLLEIQAAGRSPRVALTGGSLGIALLEAAAQLPRARTVDWERVSLYWGDERWLPSGDDERNDEQARRVFLDPLGIPASSIHRVIGAGEGQDLDSAAVAYGQEIRTALADGFDLVLLGVGPDGHMASLFPGRRDLLEARGTVVAVRESPKPPAERISLTLGTLNRAERVWLLCTGAAKRAACAQVQANAEALRCPGAAVSGKLETLLVVDAESLGA